MEEKKISEKESLELISQMIQQTKKDSVIGSGDMFLMWGYLCVLTSLSVYLITYVSMENHWRWLYLAIPVVGFIASGIMARRMSKHNKAPKTYTVQSINSIWACMSGVFVAYTAVCLAHWDEQLIWTGMYLLGLLLPGIGTYCTGIILKENMLQACGIFGMARGVFFLRDLCCEGVTTQIEWPVYISVSMFVTLVVPGHYLNHKSKKLKS